jgi:hypothetical protein
VQPSPVVAVTPSRPVVQPSPVVAVTPSRPVVQPSPVVAVTPSRPVVQPSPVVAARPPKSRDNIQRPTPPSPTRSVAKTVTSHPNEPSRDNIQRPNPPPRSVATLPAKPRRVAANADLAHPHAQPVALRPVAVHPVVLRPAPTLNRATSAENL